MTEWNRFPSRQAKHSLNIAKQQIGVLSYCLHPWLFACEAATKQELQQAMEARDIDRLRRVRAMYCSHLQHDLQREVMQHISRSLTWLLYNGSQQFKTQQFIEIWTDSIWFHSWLVGDLSLNFGENMLWAHDFKITQWLELYTFHRLPVSPVPFLCGRLWISLNAARWISSGNASRFGPRG